jgi:hypothetical protein
LQDASALAPHQRVDEERSPIWKGKRVVVSERVLGIELAEQCDAEGDFLRKPAAAMSHVLLKHQLGAG